MITNADLLFAIMWGAGTEAARFVGYTQHAQCIHFEGPRPIPGNFVWCCKNTGYTAEGIAASSYAAGMMSAAAIANGGGVAAGGLVAGLQAAGSAGIGYAVPAAAGVAAASAKVVYDGVGDIDDDDNN